MTLDDYLALGGHADAVQQIEDVLASDIRRVTPTDGA